MAYQEPEGAWGRGEDLNLTPVAMNGQLYQADFRIAQETPHGWGNNGIQFFALQRIESKAIDMATLSIDSNLPLAEALRKALPHRIRITVEIIEPSTLQKLVR